MVANAGDSRCVCSRDGTAIAMTADHKPTDKEELERISKASSCYLSAELLVLPCSDLQSLYSSGWFQAVHELIRTGRVHIQERCSVVR